MASLAGRVVTVSDRVHSGAAEDRSGPLAVQLLAEHGVAADLVVVPDDVGQIRGAVTDAAHGGASVVVLAGGTGLGPRDVTPEAVQPLLDRLLPGIGEALRAAARAALPVADLSRGFAGTLGSTVVLALPGSTGGVRDGLAVAGPLLRHAVVVLGGADHSGPAQPQPAASVVVLSAVTTDPLSVDGHEKAVAGPAAGAVVSFAGVVRDHDGGRAVQRLTYEAHPTADAVLAEVAADVASRVPGVALAVSHRVGSLVVGDVALAVAVAAAHRTAAFEASRLLVDEVKARLPVWKHQVFADGTDEWVGCA